MVRIDSASASALVVAMNSLLLAGAGVSQPMSLTSLVELLDGRVGLLGVLPLRVALLPLVVVLAGAGVVDGSVDLTPLECGPHHFGGPQLGLVLGLDAVRLQHLDDHRAEQRALAVQQRTDADNRASHLGDGAGGKRRPRWCSRLRYRHRRRQRGRPADATASNAANAIHAHRFIRAPLSSLSQIPRAAAARPIDGRTGC